MMPFLAVLDAEPRFSGTSVTRGALTIIGNARIDEIIAMDSPVVRSPGDDLEVVLQLFERFGDACVDHLIGDFAFVIWDSTRRRAFCARDFMGVKPLYYAASGTTIVVASTVGGVIEQPGVPHDLDERAIAHFLIGESFALPVDTAYASVKRLPPAHSLEWSGGAVTLRRYWSLPLEVRIRYSDPRETVDHFLTIFDRAIRDRLTEPVATVMMSGGMDSTSIAVTAQKMLSTPLHAYTISCASMCRDDEAEWAAIVAQASGMIHHVDSFESGVLFDDDPVWNRAEPLGDPMLRGFLTSAREVLQHSGMMFSGQGADVVLYTAHQHFRGLIARGRLDTFAREVLQYSWSTGKLPPFNLRAVVKAWFGLQPWRAQFPAWIRQGIIDRYDLRQTFEAGPEQELHPIRPEAHRALLNPVWSRMFETWDPDETGVPLQVVHPFFDRRLVEFLFALPAMPWFANKYLLRKAMEGRLPAATLLRPKTPLREDPIGIELRASISQIEALLERVPALEQFIEPPKLFDYLRSDARDGYSDMLAVYPICLARWSERTQHSALRIQHFST